MENGENKEKNEGVVQILMAPLRVAIFEKNSFLWILIIPLFGLINLWTALLQLNIEMARSIIDEGTIYIFSISICAPFIFDLLISLLADKRKDRKSKYVSYKIRAVFTTIIWLFILNAIWSGKLRCYLVPQIICGGISIFFAFYMYCITKMEEYKNLGIYDDTPYLEDEQGNIDNLRKDADSADSVSVDGKDVNLGK